MPYKTTPIIILLGCTLGCSTQKETKTAPEPPQPRFLPVGENPEIALDTVHGILCRTVTDPEAPANLFDPACEIPEKYESLRFVPVACSSGKTWVRSKVAGVAESKYGKLPLCIASDGYVTQFQKRK